ncbi:MAG: methyl-accepting chemotaxis protein [Rhodospirillales bacterium]|jgi:methyl-accepting chemotaxis protein|nr:methyl-accepting chemotaxis protein [Rhodospirillales bacterium]
MTIKTKTLSALGLILAMFISTIGMTTWFLQVQKLTIKSVEQMTIGVAEQAVPLLVIVKDIKLDVVQVQQSLSDISATRGQDGLDDGFLQAEEFADKFAHDVEAAGKLAKALGYIEVEELLGTVNHAFPAYYGTGIRMAKAYVAEGPAVGNKLMGEFDVTAEELGGAMDTLLAMAEQETQLTLDKMRANARGVREANSHLVALLIGCGVLSGIMALAGSLFLFLALARSFRTLSEDVATVSGEQSGRPLRLDPKRRDEFGPVARALHQFRESKIQMDHIREKHTEAERRAEEEKRRTMLKMADAFEASVGKVVGQVSSAATEMQASSEAMSATAEETTRQSAAVAAASEQASANVQTVASAAEELSSSISEISRQVTQASEIAASAVREAEQTNVKVQGLAQAANKIGEVVALITDIAEQTNLLALNATIEAARAGDAGKGFAVVASEVKNLANQTAKATDEIGAQISGIQSATQEAVAAIESITKTISKINEVNSGVASAVEEQGAATQEIARNVEQAAAGTQEVSSNIGGVSQAANDTGAAAEQISRAAGELSQRSENLRTEVDRFLASIRAA